MCFDNGRVVLGVLILMALAPGVRAAQEGLPSDAPAPEVAPSPVVPAAGVEPEAPAATAASEAPAPREDSDDHAGARAEAMFPPPPPRKLEADAGVLDGEPDFVVAPDGTVTVAWRTHTPMARGSVHYGVFLPDQELAVPRWHGSVAASAAAGDPVTTHEASFSAAVLGALEQTFSGKTNGVGRLAVRIVMPAADGRTVSFDRELGVRWFHGVYRRVAALIEGPFLCRPGPSEMTLAFRTDLPTAAHVILADEKGARWLFENDGETATHVIRLSGLAPDTTYRYQLVLFPADDPAMMIRCTEAQFRTTPSRGLGRSVRFAHLSGSRAGAGAGEWSMEGVNVRGVRELMLLAYRRGAGLILFPGGMIEGYTTSAERLRAELRSWKRAVGPIAAYVPVMVTAGSRETLVACDENGHANNRRHALTAQVFAEEFVGFAGGPPPEDGAPPHQGLVYSLGYGPVHFAFLLSSRRFAGGSGDGPGLHAGVIDAAQRKWLRRDLSLARAGGAEHIFVVSDEPGFPCGGRKGGGTYRNGELPEVQAMREDFFRILGEFQVTAYLCGGEHNYSRLRVDDALVPAMAQPVWQIVSGAAGAPLDVRDASVPWAGSVAHFSCRRHVCLFEVSGAKVTLTVVDKTGAIIENVVLSGR